MYRVHFPKGKASHCFLEACRALQLILVQRMCAGAVSATSMQGSTIIPGVAHVYGGYLCHSKAADDGFLGACGARQHSQSQLQR